MPEHCSTLRPISPAISENLALFRIDPDPLFRGRDRKRGEWAEQAESIAPNVPTGGLKCITPRGMPRYSFSLRNHRKNILTRRFGLRAAQFGRLLPTRVLGLT